MVHCHTVHLPLGALLIWSTMRGTGVQLDALVFRLLPQLYQALDGCGWDWSCWEEELVRVEVGDGGAPDP